MKYTIEKEDHFWEIRQGLKVVAIFYTRDAAIKRLTELQTK